MDQENFYLEAIPQSEYRRINSKRRVNERQLLDLNLSPLSLSDATLKAELKLKIKTEIMGALHTLLPDSTLEDLNQDKLLNPIYSGLDLL